MRPSDERRTVVSAYVAERLTKEKDAEGHGYIARVARATGFRGPTLSTVANGKPIGHDLAEALAKFWNLRDYEGLRDAAVAWWRAEGKSLPHLRAAVRVHADGTADNPSDPLAPYPNLRAVLAEKSYPPEAVESALPLARARGGDLLPEGWRFLLDAYVRNVDEVARLEEEAELRAAAAEPGLPLAVVLRLMPQWRGIAEREGVTSKTPVPPEGWYEWLQARMTYPDEY